MTTAMKVACSAALKAMAVGLSTALSALAGGFDADVAAVPLVTPPAVDPTPAPEPTPAPAPGLPADTVQSAWWGAENAVGPPAIEVTTQVRSLFAANTPFIPRTQNWGDPTGFDPRLGGEFLTVDYTDSTGPHTVSVSGVYQFMIPG